MRTLSLLVLACCLCGEALAQDCMDTAIDEDCDGDGFLPPDDCDDEDELVNPDAEDACGNDVDDNCDGDVDESCLEAIREGRLEGGATCEGNGNGWAGLLLVPPLLWRRRERR